jgi:hypothetical protein
MRFCFKFLSVLLLPFLISSVSVSAQFSETDSPDSLSLGRVSFQFNTDSALAIINNKFQNAFTVYPGDTINVETGLTSVKLSVIHDHLYEKVFSLKKDSLISINHDFKNLPLTKGLLNGNHAARKFFNANLLVISDEESEIYLNDQLVGKNFVYLNAPTTKNTIMVQNPEVYQSLFIQNISTISTSDYSFRVVENYIRPQESTSKRLAFFPGFSQAYKYQGTKAILIRIGMGASLLGLTTFEAKYRIDRKEYDNLLDRYNNSISILEVTALGDQLHEKEQSLRTSSRIRNTSLFALAGIYVFNVLDGFFTKPKTGYRNEKPLNFYLSTNHESGVNLNFNLELGN